MLLHRVCAIRFGVYAKLERCRSIRCDKVARDHKRTEHPARARQETKAMFVDETACIGCLKCALVADKTFAIETRKGKAR
eukprot:5489129-Pyramimonas_sp.AAC.1